MVLPPGVPVSGDCMISGCGEEPVADGLCRMHYDRLRRTGTPVKQRRSRACLVCGRYFEAERTTKKVCGPTCRKRWQRMRQASGYRLDSTPNPLKSVDWERPKEKTPQPAAVEVFTVGDVWHASGGACLVCGGIVRRTAGPREPAYGIPVWRVPPDMGGQPALANKAIVHPGCERRDGNGILRTCRGRNGAPHAGKRKEGAQGRRRNKPRTSQA